METRLLIQPGSGTADLIAGIDAARESIHIVVFRFDRREIALALMRAARRGVFVHALVAHTSAGQGGEATLRRLETQLLAAGITVARSGSDLVRYHNKLMIVDGKTLFLLCFNFTHIDIDRSRSFGIVTEREDWVREAERLFLADAMRQTYEPECETFIVSPGNSRRRLTELIRSAERRLLIYDDKLSDPAMMRLLSARSREGLDVRVIGSIGRRAIGVQASPLYMRLHGQVIIRDDVEMYLGSQSLRTLELDARRESGIITDNAEIISKVQLTFESDWNRSFNTTAPKLQMVEAAPVEDVEQEPVNETSPEISAVFMKAAVKEAIKDVLLERLEPDVPPGPLKDAVKQAAREALHELAI